MIRKYLTIVSLAVLVTVGSCTSSSIEEKDTRNYIAHAGGEIGGHLYTNSLEAVENSLANGVNYIELDLGLTADGTLVAVHDWEWFREMSGKNISDLPLGYEEFMNSKLFGELTPLSASSIVDLLEKYPQFHLVTDKISDPEILQKYFGQYSDRIIVECFTKKDYNTLKSLGFKCFISSTPSPWWKHYLKKLAGVISPFPDSYVTSLSRYEKSINGGYFKQPAQGVETAIYTVANKTSADSIFNLYPDVRFVYIDSTK